MKQIYLLSIITMVTLANAEIRTDEITLRLGETIDFESGEIHTIRKDTVTRSYCKDMDGNFWHQNASLLCGQDSSFQNDLGFFFNGAVVDCGGAPPPYDCTEALKSIYSPTRIYEFIKSAFYEDLTTPVDTADTLSLVNQTQVEYTSVHTTSETNAACTLYQGPTIYITAPEGSFYHYYYLVTDKGNACIFTILGRETVESKCVIDRYNALRIQYFLQTESGEGFSSIAPKIRERMATSVKTHSVLLQNRNLRVNTSSKLTCDMLGRMPEKQGNAAGVKIRGNNVQKPSGAVTVK